MGSKKDSPKYVVLEKFSYFEIRIYEPQVVAKLVIEASFEQAIEKLSFVKNSHIALKQVKSQKMGSFTFLRICTEKSIKKNTRFIELIKQRRYTSIDSYILATYDLLRGFPLFCRNKLLFAIE